MVVGSISTRRKDLFLFPCTGKKIKCGVGLYNSTPTFTRKLGGKWGTESLSTRCNLSYLFLPDDVNETQP